MTPSFATGLIHPAAMLPPEAFALAFPDSAAKTAPQCGYAVIPIGTRRRAQGPVLRRWRDGRVSIDAGGRIVTGYPQGMAARPGWWARLGGAARP